MASTSQQEISPALADAGRAVRPRSAYPLRDSDQAEVLEFLTARPIHTVFMASLIRDNGLVNGLNRGTFFGYRNDSGALAGVALLGHATLIETESEDCIRAFAHLASTQPAFHLIRGEQEKIESFWNHYNATNHNRRLMCGELLLELKTKPSALEAVAGLRQATLDDLETIVKVNATMACEESGINPLTKDPQGFRDRSARRIQKGRVWVWIEDDCLVYKTDIIAETPQAIYLEGVYVHPEHRTRGYGLRCLSQLAEVLLTRTQTICLTVNEKSLASQQFYKRAGYELAGRYDTIYLS